MPVDPFDVFLQARCFLQSGATLGDGFTAGSHYQFRPYIVLFVFGLELLLKCVFYDSSRGNPAPNSHDPSEIFKFLNAFDQWIIRKYYDEYAGTNALESAARSRPELVGLAESARLESVLVRCNLFDVVRYEFEGHQWTKDRAGGCGTSGINNVVRAVCRLIRERHPDWEYRFLLTNTPSDLFRLPLGPHA